MHMQLEFYFKACDLSVVVITFQMEPTAGAIPCFCATLYPTVWYVAVV